MIHPEYRILRETQDAAINETLTAIYPATEGVQQGRLRNLTDQALRLMQRDPPEELLPETVRNKLDLPELAAATRVWRDFAESPEAYYREGYACIRNGWDAA